MKVGRSLYGKDVPTWDYEFPDLVALKESLLGFCYTQLNPIPTDTLGFRLPETYSVHFSDEVPTEKGLLTLPFILFICNSYHAVLGLNHQFFGGKVLGTRDNVQSTPMI